MIWTQFGAMLPQAFGKRIRNVSQILGGLCSLRAVVAQEQAMETFGMSRKQADKP